ncbi:MAG: hypothetical protein AAGA99_00690 [Actinomycetota bacterium]
MTNYVPTPTILDLLGGTGAPGHTNNQWLTDTMTLYGVDAASHTPNRETVADLADIAGGARVYSGTLLGKTCVSNGSGRVTAAAADLVVAAVSGSQFEYVYIVGDGTGDSDSPVMAFYDTATGLPATPTGAAITHVFSQNGIFYLGA